MKSIGSLIGSKTLADFNQHRIKCENYHLFVELNKHWNGEFNRKIEDVIMEHIKLVLAVNGVYTKLIQELEKTYATAQQQ